MKHPLDPAQYTFDASAKKITFNFSPVPGTILVIVNVTHGIVIYSLSIPAKIGTFVGPELTLLYDTSVDMDDTDDLLIQWEDNAFVQAVSNSAGATSANQVTTNTKIDSLLAELQLKADLTETQPVSLATIPYNASAASAANQVSTNTKLDALLTELQLKADVTETQPVSIASIPLATNASTSAKQDTMITALASLLTELQLKADLTETQPVSLVSIPYNSSSASSALQTSANTKLDSLITELQLKADLTETQPVSVASLPLPSGAATEATLGTRLSESDFDTKTGSLTETAPSTDTASSGINGRLQRVSQRITSLLTELQGKADLNETQPVSIATLPLPSGAATETTLGTRLSESDFDTKTGSLTETAPASDTASSGINGRMQRIAQRLTALLTELQGKADLTETQPVSAASLPLPSGAATSALQTTINTSVQSLLTEMQLKADLTETQPVALQAGTSGGTTPYTLLSAGSNNATSLKASAGQVYSVQVFNLNASPRYLKFYNKATAPSPASDTVVKSIMIPGNTSGAGVAYTIPVGVAFSTGIAFALVTGISNTDNTGVAASEIIVNIDYK